MLLFLLRKVLALSQDKNLSDAYNQGQLDLIRELLEQMANEKAG